MSGNTSGENIKRETASGYEEAAERVSRMESYLDISSAAVRELSRALDRYEAALAQYEELTEYYGSSEWRADLEADEAGHLEGIRRGVLSEDAVYDLITEHEELIARLRDAARRDESSAEVTDGKDE